MIDRKALEIQLLGDESLPPLTGGNGRSCDHKNGVAVRPLAGPVAKRDLLGS